MNNKTPELCSEELTDLINVTISKYPKAKVVVSLGIPRNNEEFNRKVEKLNVLIKENLHNKSNVVICDNGNLFYRGQQSYGVLNSDGVHLTRTGTTKLTSNIKQSLCTALNLPRDMDNRRNSYDHNWGRRQWNWRRFYS